MQLIANKAFDFGGRRVRAGDRIDEPSERKARMLVTMGRAEIAQPDDLTEAPERKRKYKTRAMTPED